MALKCNLLKKTPKKSHKMCGRNKFTAKKSIRAISSFLFLCWFLNLMKESSEIRNHIYLATKFAILVQLPAPVSSPLSCNTGTFSRRLPFVTPGIALK